MAWFRILLLALASLEYASAINPKCSSYTGVGRLVATVAAQLSPYPVAQSFCSSRFPIPISTTTITAAARTATTIVATNIVSTTVATTTLTSTTTSTSITTVTDVVNPARKLKRIALPFPAPNPAATTLTTITATNSLQAVSAALTAAAASAQASPSKVLSSLLAYNSAIAASICTCVESTPIATATSTPTVTTSVTATSTTSLTATTTTTTTVPVTTTATVTTTAAAAPTCVSQQQCNSGYVIENYCNTRLSGSYSPSAVLSGFASGVDCGNSCAGDASCITFDYNSATQQCSFYDVSIANFQQVADTSHYSGTLVNYC